MICCLFCFNSRLRSKSNIIQEPSDKSAKKIGKFVIFCLFCFNSRLRSKSNIIQEPSDKSAKKSFSYRPSYKSNLMRKNIRYFQLAKKRTKVVSFHRLSGTGMTSLILLSPLLKCLMTVCPSSHLL